MADGNFYVDSKLPFISADVPAVTLASTFKAMVPAANLPVLGGNYFGFIGKGVRVRIFGRITTALTPGNGQFSIHYGTGADANGVSLASVAFALTASMTGSAFEAEALVRCRSMGAAGTLFCTGSLKILNSATALAAASVFMLPANSPVASGAVDLTAALLLSPQFLRTGSTAETLQVHDVSFEALN